MGNNIGMTATSLQALTQRFETVTDNIANSNSVAYKRRRTQFQQVLNGKMAAAGAATAAKAGNRGPIDFTQGSFIETGRPLDLAIDGKALFVIESPQGVQYTRNGTFLLNNQGQLVDSVGRFVSGDNGPITIPKSASKIHVSPQGTIEADGVKVGRLKLVEFPPAILTPVGSGSYRAPAGVEPTAAATSQIRQGYVESSNVNIAEELVNLITVSRMYEASLKTVNVQDDKMKNLMQVAMS